MRRREDYTGWDGARNAKTITTGGTGEHRGRLGSFTLLARSFRHEGHEVSRRNGRLETMGKGPDTRKPSPQGAQRNTGECLARFRCWHGAFTTKDTKYHEGMSD